MRIENNFLLQTGDISVDFKYAPSSSEEFWSFSLGLTGQLNDRVSFSGTGGRIYDSEGLFVASYQDEAISKITILGDSVTFYNNDTICTSKIQNTYDKNNFIFTSEKDAFLPSIKVNGQEGESADKKILFVTLYETGDLCILNNLQTLTQQTITTTSYYTGTNIYGNVDNINQYDLILLAPSLERGALSMSGSWASVIKPKIIFAQKTIEDLGIAQMTPAVSSVYLTNLSDDLTRKIDNTVLQEGFSNTGAAHSFSKTGLAMSQYSGGLPFISKHSSGMYGDWNFIGDFYFCNYSGDFNNLSDFGRKTLNNLFISVL